MTPRVLRVVRAIALLSGVGAAACSSRDAGPTKRLGEDFVPDEQALITTNDAYVNPNVDTSVQPEPDSAAGDSYDASIPDVTNPYVDTLVADTDDDTGLWMLPETCPQPPADASDDGDLAEDEASVSTDAIADTSSDDATPIYTRTCRCEFEEVWQYPCIPPCTQYLEAELNGCVAGPQPPPDLPSA